MKKTIFLLGTVLGMVLAGSIVYALTMSSSDITYDNTRSGLKDLNNNDVDNVKDAIDILYSKVNKGSYNKVCYYISGTKGTIGSKYLCDPGDGKARYFYILSTNGSDVDLIMEKNITDEVLVNNSRTLSYNDAMTYFNEGNPGNVIRQSWTNVKNVDSPSIQVITNSSGISSWNVENAQSSNWSYFGINSTTDSSKIANYKWLYDYTKNCSLCDNPYPNDNQYPRGYWTKELVSNNNNAAWVVSDWGGIDVKTITDTTTRGVRPVITIKNSELSN